MYINGKSSIWLENVTLQIQFYNIHLLWKQLVRRWGCCFSKIWNQLRIGHCSLILDKHSDVSVINIIESSSICRHRKISFIKNLYTTELPGNTDYCVRWSLEFRFVKQLKYFIKPYQSTLYDIAQLNRSLE